MAEKDKKEDLVYVDNKNSKIFEPENKDKFKEFYVNFINIDGYPEEKDKKDEKFYRSQFYAYIKNKVNNFIYVQKDNIVFLLGAGASVLGKEWKYGKTMSRLACEIIDNLYSVHNSNGEENKVKPKVKGILPFDKFAKLSNISDPVKLKNMVIKVLYDENQDEQSGAEKKQSEDDKSKKNKTKNDDLKTNEEQPDFKLEDFISILNKILNLDEESFYLFTTSKDKNFVEQVKKTRNLILQNISELVQYKDYPFEDKNESFQHLAIMKTLMAKLNKDDVKLEIVTTNYDQVIEKAAEKGKITVFDGFGFNSHPIFDDSWFDWNLSKKVKYLNTNEVEYKPNVIDLLKIHGSIDWVREDNEIVKQKSISENQNMENQVMIFPSSDKYKQSYDKPYFELMSRFQNYLRKPNTLLITSGFSFSDEHISRMITDAIKVNSGLRILITDYNINNKSYNNIKDLISNNYDIALLRAAMNDTDSDHGLHFYLN